MAEFVAGRGTEALGIIGTVLGGAALAGNGGLSNILGGLGNNRNTDTCAMAALGAAIPQMLNNNYDNGTQHRMTQYEIGLIEKSYAKDVELAQLKSEHYTDRAIQELKDQAAVKWADQAVINANVNTGLTALGGQVASVADTVAHITQTVIPTKVICNAGCNCNGNGNI